MSISLSKTLKQKQGLRLTPSLKKSIDLLQLSRFELIKKIEKEINENPFIEKNEINDNLTNFKKSDFNFDIESKVNLRESLIKQLDDFHLNNKDKNIAKLIIGCLDESGELTESIESIEEISNFKYTAKDIGNNLRSVIHKLSPVGVGFRNHKECIKIQIDNKESLSDSQRELIEEVLSNEKLDNLDAVSYTHLTLPTHREV